MKSESSSLSEMPEGRRNSQPFTKQQEHRRIFGSLPNILDGLASDKNVAVKKKKRFKSSAHQKQLSLEEGKILNTLDKMYKEIDPNTPDDLLTTEQVVIRKLKTLYEDESSSYRPVAPRNKGDLAISKPLLDSVYSNPKLETIAKNPDMLCLENDRFSWMGHKKCTDDAPETSDTPPSLSGFREETNPNTFYNNEEQFQLKRYSSKEDLLDLFKDEETVYKSLKSKSKKRSSLKSSNSGSISNYSQKKRVSFDEKRNSCFTIKEFLTYESLEDIYKSIDPHVPEQQLTKEQRFALRVKTSCYNLGEKSELRKRPTFKKKKVTISWPTKESVMRNTKLRSIINDPIVRSVGEDAEEQETVELRNLKRMRKYLGDTNVVLRNSELYKRRPNICKNDSRLSTSLEDVSRKGRLIVDRPFSSMENLSSDSTDQMGKSGVQIEVTTNMLPAKSFASSFVFSSSSSSVDNSNENLMKKAEDAPVVFVEHFEPEEVKFREKTGVKIREMSANSIIRNSQLTDESEYTGRISFPDEEGLANKNSDSRVLSFSCVEMSDEHDNLHDKQSFQEVYPSVLVSVPQQYEVDKVIETFNETIGIAEFEAHKKEEQYTSVNIQSDDEKEELSMNQTVPDEFEKSISDAFSYLSNRISDISRESWEEEERMQVKAKYVDVVQEIKRKYSLQCPSDNSDEEEINIFSPNEGKIEVTKSSKEDNNICSSRLAARSEIFSNEKFVHDECKRSVKSDIFLGKPYLEEISLNIKENEQYIQKIQDQGNAYLPIEEKNFIKLIRQEHEEDFKEIDTLGYITDENIELNQKVHSQNNDSMQKVNSELCLVKMGKSADEPSEENLSEGSCDGLKHIVDTYKTKNINKPENVKKMQEQTKRTPHMDKRASNSGKDSQNQYLKSRASFTESSTLSAENQNDSSIEEKNVVELFKNLSKSEQDLISSLHERNSRPISAINIDDIAFIEAMKNKYLKHDNSPNAGHFDDSEICERVDVFSNSEINTSICENNSNSVRLIVGAESDCNKLCSSANDTKNISELINEFLMNERNIHLGAPEIYTLKENHDNEDKTFVTDDVYNEVGYESIVKLNNKEHNSVKCSVGYDIRNANYFEPEFISRKEVVISSPRNSNEHRNSSIITRKEENMPSVFLSSLKNSLTNSSLDSISYEPVYENYLELQKRQQKNFDNIQRKPKPLPRNLNSSSSEKREYICDKTDIRKKNMNTENVTSMKPKAYVSVNYVKVESENHEPLPNYSKVMEKTDDIIGMESKADSVLDRCLISYSNTTKRIESPSRTDVEKSSSDFVSDTHSSNILVRKTKKFIKEGDQMEEFDETVGVSNIELENVPDFGKFDKDRQLIPEDLIDYANSESKITLFNNESKETNEYFEPCSRPQTSRQSSTPFRLSCYGEDSNESFDLKTEVSHRKSSEMVAHLKEKFENLADEQNESKRTSITGKEYVEARRSNLPKLFKERDAYDLVFKTNSKYWFDNNSELERSDATIHQSTPNFEPSSSTTPLNITILDPVESKTNTNYQHLFESDTLLGRKPFHDGVGHLSELNLKTSIPCVDFTTLPTIEKESNASLFEYGLDTEVKTSGKSDGETIGCFPKKKPT
ncbi:hypothetical protein WA026_002818 [Henosepilachna vigintioctopunctata]|uniref:Uncharacterized protein n=1 Tax=Henosepilachna vigintioctopunctata TaxID=420089 RepID=A0AAW1U0R5_9CUCU